MNTCRRHCWSRFSRPTFPLPVWVADGSWLGIWLLLIVAVPQLGWAAPLPVVHEPLQPHSGQAVRIQVGAAVAGDAKDLVLEYQVVPPGKYVAKADARYLKDWTSVPLLRGAAGERTAEIPGTLQKHRHLVRYRIRSMPANVVVAPPSGDAQGNYAYFVYDGVPAWRGAINPRGDAAERELKTFSPEQLTRVPVYHWIARQDAVENVMWHESSGVFGGDARHAYQYTGTMVSDGVVYDHVRFRARGGGWRHAMGKNMWKFNFNPGHRFEARDEYGRGYAIKWDKLHLGACIQQGDYGMRGEQGLFESTTFRLFNLAGTEAPHTHWVHLRVVTGAEETPADQYRGDFWGLYLATEEIDGAFLKEHALPDGNVYKIEGFAPTVEHLADPAQRTADDARQFIGHVMQGGPGEKWWRTNVDLPRYYNYRAVLEAVHHYDVDAGKNYFFYHNLTAQRWQVIPWDVDLTWGERMYGGGREPFVDPVLGRSGTFRGEYQERLAELKDLLLNPEALGRIIDEQAAKIWNGSAELSLADADRAKWDYHPIMSSPLSQRGKSDPGLFYHGNSKSRIDVMVQGMKKYAANRHRFLERLLTGYQPPVAPKVTGPKSVRLNEGPPHLQASGADEAKVYRWRLAEITDPQAASFTPHQPWQHEIQSLWESGDVIGPGLDLPVATLRSGHTYRVRVRRQTVDGRWSRWSEPWQWVAQ